MVAETYNGWSNYETWNVALWLQNDFGLYSIATLCTDYWDFISSCVETGMVKTTPDGVYFDDPRLNFQELDYMIQELSQ